MADEYKDPNTDIMKALSKAVDAATGETGTQYEYKNPNTDIIQKLEELIEAISSGHNYSTTEQVVGTWIDGSTLYERTIILRENGVDKYTFTGSMSEGGDYAVGLTGIDKIWLEGLYAKRGRSDNINYTDIDNTSTEVLTVYKHSDGSFYFRDIFNPVDIILTIRYTKTST